MNKPPTFIDKRPSARDLIKRMYSYNVQMNALSKKAVGELHTGNLEGLLQNFSMLMTGNYGDQETIEMPVEVVRQSSLFAATTLSRLVWERYKLEKTLGRSVVDAPLEQPDAVDLAKILSEDLTDDES